MGHGLYGIREVTRARIVERGLYAYPNIEERYKGHRVEPFLLA